MRQRAAVAAVAWASMPAASVDEPPSPSAVGHRRRCSYVWPGFRADDAFHRPKPIHEGRNVGKGHCLMVAPS